MNHSYIDPDELGAALRWQLEMGIDCALSDHPETDSPIQPVQIIAKQAGPTSVSASLPDWNQKQLTPSVSQKPATETVVVQNQPDMPSVSSISDLHKLKEALSAFEGCALKKTASNLVFADGNPEADIMLIGEAPGRDEDRMGLPFVGAAGQLLDKMLLSIGLDRQSVYITNILPWRPPGNRTPSVEETQMMWPFLKRHIQLVAPKIIFALGGSSAKLLLNTQTGILKLRGQMTDIDFSDDQSGLFKIPVLPSLHPAYLLRAPNMKKQAFADLVMLKKQLRIK